MSEKKIIIHCDGGLGNKFNSLLGGIVIARMYGIDNITINWPLNNFCFCKLDKIIDIKYKITNIDINTLLNNNKKYLLIIKEKYDCNNELLIFSQKSLEIISTKKNIIYYNWFLPEMFVESSINLLKRLKINNKLIETANLFISNNNINNNIIGIHLRRTDSRFDPDENNKFLDIIKNNQNNKYFICSDDKNTEDLFRNLDNVIIFPKKSYVEKFKKGDWNDLIIDNAGRRYNYNVSRSEESVINAFIDLLILSKTNLYIYPSKGTFYNLAKLYNKI